jgi:hypothetical protein
MGGLFGGCLFAGILHESMSVLRDVIQTEAVNVEKFWHELRGGVKV